jgi:hypothetical protein
VRSSVLSGAQRDRRRTVVVPLPPLGGRVRWVRRRSRPVKPARFARGRALRVDRPLVVDAAPWGRARPHRTGRPAGAVRVGGRPAAPPVTSPEGARHVRHHSTRPHPSDRRPDAWLATAPTATRSCGDFPRSVRRRRCWRSSSPATLARVRRAGRPTTWLTWSGLPGTARSCGQPGTAAPVPCHDVVSTDTVTVRLWLPALTERQLARLPHALAIAYRFPVHGEPSR